MRRFREVLQILCSVTVLAGLSPQCGAQEWSGYVTADDGTLLATDVYMPAGEGPWPVVLTRTPYDKGNPGHYPDWCRSLTLYGYACVAQDCRGRYASTGSDSVFRDAGRDGRATLRWIADQPWCNGAIASAGGSAMGFTGYGMVPGAPPELKCLFAAVAAPELYSHAMWFGGVLRWELAYNWLVSQGSIELFDEFVEHRLWGPWWNDYDWLSSVDEVRVKGLHFGGWWDLYVDGPATGFSEYQHRGGEGARGNQHLVMGPWHHFSVATDWVAQTYPGERDTGELRFPENAFPDAWAFPGDEWQLLLDWLGYCLEDESTDAATWPEARVYLMGAVGEEGAPGNRWIDLDDWPPPATEVAFNLTAAHELSRDPVDDGELILLIDPDDPVPTLGGANHFPDIEVDGRPMGIGPMDQRQVEVRDDVLVFSSPVLDRPLTVVGPVRCRLWIRPDTPDLDLSVRLTDVYPDGCSMLILDGIQRARARCGDDRECFLEPGVPTEIEVELLSTAIVFNAGHRIRVAIAGSNWPRFEVNPNDGGDLDDGTPIVALPSLLFGEEHPSGLLLPVIQPPRRSGGRVTVP